MIEFVRLLLLFIESLSFGSFFLFAVTVKAAGGVKKLRFQARWINFYSWSLHETVRNYIDRLLFQLLASSHGQAGHYLKPVPIPIHSHITKEKSLVFIAQFFLIFRDRGIYG